MNDPVAEACPEPERPPAEHVEIILRAAALLELGQGDEVEAELAVLPRESRIAWMEAQKLRMERANEEGRFRDAITIGTDALGGARIIDEPSSRVARVLVLSLQFARRYEEELPWLHEICRWKRKPELEAHQIACCLARMGRPLEALQSLHLHLRHLPQPDPVLLFDGDLALMWEQLEHGALTLETAHLLRAQEFARFEAWPNPNLADAQFSWMDFDEFTPGWLELMHFPFGFMRLHPRASDRYPGRHSTWLREARQRLASIRSRIASVRTAALRKVVQAQYGYARWHLARSNHLAARHRILFLLAHDPTALPRLRHDPAFRAIAPLLEELTLLQDHARDFLERVVLGVYRGEALSSDEQWQRVESAPPLVKATNLWRREKVVLLDDDNDLLRAFPLFAALAEAWPRDAFPMGAFALALVRNGRIETAARALEQAAPSLQDFRVFGRMRVAIQERNVAPIPIPFDFSRISEPDMGGILCPDAVPPLRVGESTIASDEASFLALPSNGTFRLLQR